MPTVSQLLLAQVAAESYLTAPIGQVDILRLGSNNPANPLYQPGAVVLPGATRMTDAQIVQFSQEYQIINHQPNTWSGFSATLMRHVSGEYVLSFRSTEYQNDTDGGDFQRDGLGGAGTEIANYGFAFAQIADMEAYYRQLRQLGGPLENAQFTVTGYSLGGHLATVFAEAHGTDSGFKGAVTFNAPGRGAMSQENVAGLVNDIYTRLAHPQVQATLRNGVGGDGLSNRQAIYTDNSFYQPAVDAVRLTYGTAGLLATTNEGRADLAGGRITQVYGAADFDDRTVVANSGIHSGNYVRVFIEDQPNIQGLGITWFDDFLRIKSDFGATHSIVLIADSVAVSDLLNRIDPTITLEGTSGLLSLGSNERGITRILDSGRAESDSLERVVESLAGLYGAVLSQPIVIGALGGEFANRGFRNSVYEAISSLESRVSTIGGGQLVSLRDVPGVALAAIAAQDGDIGLAYRYALVTGESFAVELSRSQLLQLGHTAGGRLDRLDSAANRGLLSDQYLADRADYVERRTYFNANNARYDRTRPSTNPAHFGDPIATRYDGEHTVWTDVASATTIRRRSDGSDAQIQYRMFGDDSADTLSGGGGVDRIYGGAGADSLIGLEGDDRLEGGTEADRLEGGKGSDILLGGAGDDAYHFRVGDGADRIQDADRRGRIFVDGTERVDVASTLFAVTGQVNAWRSPDGTISITHNSPFRLTYGSGDEVDLGETLNDGDFGIHLLDRPGAEAPVENIVTGSSESDGEWSLDGLVFTPLESGLAGADEVRGQAGDDALAGRDGEDRLFGDEGSDYLLGGLGDDLLAGGTDTDILLGQDGDDALYAEGLVDGDFVLTMQAAIASEATPAGTTKEFLGGGAGNDLLVGGTGADLLSGGQGIDVLIGGAGADAIWGDTELVATARDWSVGAGGFVNVTGASPPAGAGGDDAIYAGGGDDLVAAEAGNDYVDGGAGNDQLLGHEGNDVLVGGEGDDLIAGETLAGDVAHPLTDAQHGDDYLEGGAGDDELVGNGGADVLHGGEGNDLLFGDDLSVAAAYQGDDLIHGEAGDDRVFAGGGADTLSGGEGHDVLLGEAGDDQIAGGTGNDELLGGAGADALLGDEGLDLLAGGDGNDYLDGGEGDDQLAGGEGNDALLGGAGDDLLSGEAGGDDLDGGEGTDLLAGGGGDDFLAGGEGADELQGGEGADALEGGADNDRLFGEAGNDHLSGGEGNDLLFGGIGNDELAGGSGADQYFVDSGGGRDVIRDQPGQGNTLLFGSGIQPSAVTLTLGSLQINVPGGGEVHLEDFDPENAQGSVAIDTFVFAEGGVYSAAQFLERGIQITGTPDEDILRGTSVNDIIAGLAADDLILGRAGNDRLDGGEGNDILRGENGDDTLVSGPGADLLEGGEGADTYEVNNAADAVDDQFLELGTSGRDRVLSTVTFDLAGRDGIEDLALAGSAAIDGFGSAAENRITGNDAANVLDGREGDDSLAGGAGDDTLEGGSGNDFLHGESGNDTLHAGTGDDDLLGDGGNDTYFLASGSGSDTIREERFADIGQTVGGVDALRFAAGLTAADVVLTRDLNHLYVSLPGGSATVEHNYERLPFNGIAGAVERVQFFAGGAWTDAAVEAAITVTPATGAEDVIYASGRADAIDALGGDDTIYGFGGDDVITGGAGNDRLSGGEGNDIYLFGRGSGQDAVDDYDYGFRFIPQTGPITNWHGWDHGFSHSAAEVDTVRIAGGVASNEIEVTRAGADLVLSIRDTGDRLRLVGWAVDDPYEAQHPGRQQFVEFDDGSVWDKAGVRTLVDAGAGTEGNDILDGTDCPDTMNGRGGDDSVHGRLGNDRIDGGAGNDMLFGDEGDDTIAGGAGNDTIEGGAGADSYVFNAGDGQDLINNTGANGDSDRIVLGAGIDVGQVLLRRIAGGTLEVTYGTADRIWLGGHYANDSRPNIGEITLATGEFWDNAKILQSVNTGGAGADALPGTPLADTVTGGPGNDAVSGDLGDDVLDGGAGNDLFDGGRGATTVLFGRDSGKDHLFVASPFGTIPASTRVVMGPDISPADISDATGIIHIRGTSDVLTYSGASSVVVQFSDGTLWNGLEPEHRRVAAAMQLNGATEGTFGDDVLVGSFEDESIWTVGGNDTLSGGAGTDTLAGGKGDDIYLFARGDGHDRIDQSDANGFIDIDRIRFAPGIAPGDVRVAQRGNDFAFLVGATDSITVPNWTLGASHQVDEVQFNGGVVWSVAIVQSLAAMEATGGDDTLNGTEGDDQLAGLDGNDTLNGLGGSDLLDGGTGNDILRGGAGGDSYRFGHSYGSDEVIDADSATEFHRIELTADVLPAQVEVLGGGLTGGYTLAIAGSGDSLRLTSSAGGGFPGFPGFPGGGGQVVDEVRFLSDGTTWSWATLGARVGIAATDRAPWSPTAANTAPVLMSPIADVAGAQGTFLRAQVPVDAVADADAGDALAYTLRQASGAALPGWLRFDAATRTLLGTPIYSDVGSVDLRLTATDRAGATVSDTFTVTIADLNDAPFLARPLPHVRVNPGATLAYRVAADAFSDVDAGDTLTLSVALADGSAPPSWLTFDASTRTLAGTPQAAQLGELSLRVTATDTGGLTATDSFRLVVEEPPAPEGVAPVVAAPLPDQSATEDQPFTFQAPESTFYDPDDTVATPEGPHSCLTWSARLADGSPLPAWLKFNLVSRTFFGTPGDADVGEVAVRVTVTDHAGQTASDVFRIAVTGVNDAPLAQPDAGEVREDLVLVATGSVLDNDIDPDVGDTLAVANPGAYAGAYGALALTADGAWSYALENDAAQSLGANALAEDIFALAVTDGEAFAASALTVVVQGTNDAPVLNAQFDDVHLHAGDSLSYAIPGNAFIDIDFGDTLALSVSLVGGGALPSWLTYDAAARTLSGVATAADTGEYGIQLVATDSQGAQAAAQFTIEVEALCDDGQVFEGTVGADDLIGTACNDSFRYTEDGRWTGGESTVNAFTGRVEGLASHSMSRDSFDGQGGFDLFTGTALHDAILLDAGDTAPRLVAIEHFAMGEGNDVVNLTSNRFAYGDAVLDGGAGNDTLWAGAGDDVLVGGAGNDNLAGGAGGDVYVHGLHDGHDTLEENGDGFDTLIFGADIAAADVSLERRGDDLYAQVGGPGGSVTLRGWFSAAASRVDELRFADGTSWDAAQMAIRVVRTNQGSSASAGDAGGGNGGQPHPASGNGNAAATAASATSAQAGESASAPVAPTPDPLARRPHYDFEALLRASGSGGDVNALSTSQIARQWSQVASYASAVGAVPGADSGSVYVPAWARLSAPQAHSWGFEGSIGAAQGPAELRSLEGLREGFARL